MTATGGAPDLAGRRVLLTGASRGIGAVVARHLAGLGAELVLVARNHQAIDALASELPGTGHQAIALDVADETAWQDAAGRLAPAGAVHGVVTAAALLHPIGPLGTWPVAEFRRTLDTNVVGTLLAVLSCLESLQASNGSVVTFSGGGATAPLPRFDAYAASKAAVVRLTENLAADLAGSGVRLNSVAPGFVVTPMHNETLQAGPERVGVDYYDKTRRAVEQGGGDPPQLVAELTAFLLSDDSEGITGKLLSARWDP
ncbi:MAG: family oxidoreductase, partial [Acidimicrobiaceae bacterium]|nr:family oxidoreductase [Acidimicrobiaceae bacterium]